MRQGYEKLDMNRRSHTILPIIENWREIRGIHTGCGALRARTEAESESLVFRCPRCNAYLSGGSGIRLLGISDSLDECHAVHLLAFRIHCSHCKLWDHFRLPVSQYSTYGTGRGIPAP